MLRRAPGWHGSGEVKPLYVLGPNLSREEVKEVRRLLAAREDRPVLLCNAASHTPGQEVAGDVVVVGDQAPTAERDARGTFKRYASMDEFREAVAGKDGPAPEPQPQPKPHPRPQPPAPPSQPQPQVPAAKSQAQAVQPPPAEPDKFAGMDRVQLIRYGADHFPRKKQWALLKEDDLKVELRKLEAGD